MATWHGFLNIRKFNGDFHHSPYKKMAILEPSAFLRHTMTPMSPWNFRSLVNPLIPHQQHGWWLVICKKKHHAAFGDVGSHWIYPHTRVGERIRWLMTWQWPRFRDFSGCKTMKFGEHSAFSDKPVLWRVCACIYIYIYYIYMLYIICMYIYILYLYKYTN